MDVVAQVYEAVDARDADRLAALLAPDVDWPEPMGGGRLRGRDAVRRHWQDQWAVLDVTMAPRRTRVLPDGRVEVLVEVVVRDADGDLLGGATVLHTHTLAGDRVARMDVGDPLGPL
ncbi:nuclear transport factor 2 family protein [Modestobacter sp. VKM Ac-2986]|uniref:nuclear transport factor 2 family protein n=1 Tax=Modestobacter sp. VKM Ac-2986 TaxID=3004140 RepID=UPI0022AB57AA|nr:nuclear transport factor 2 family protein [Modestobacter sp. VKM Ac-2986]MCZ2829325.1 nuclear transport factor 2 family protein [Modestobacter sp. VKM Ac-2986]